MKKHTVHDVGDGIVIETAQDVTDIVERNKLEYNNSTSTWGEDVFDNKIARVANIGYVVFLHSGCLLCVWGEGSIKLQPQV